MKLGLGTVQFGIDYGVTNPYGKTSANEVSKILQTATNNNINIIDTAPSYGDCEELLGCVLPKTLPFKIITKTPHFHGKIIKGEAAQHLETIFMRSIDNMRLSSVYGLLVHNADDLNSNSGNYIMEKMEDLKKRGLVQKIGVSIYTADQLNKIMDHYQIDIVQLPINVLDQRLLLSGHLEKLFRMGVEIHARSIFLQGVLLIAPENLPTHFHPVKKHLQKYMRLLQHHNLTPLQGALGFINSISEIDCTICGVNTDTQLKELCAANMPVNDINFREFSFDDEQIINPQLWPQ